MASNVSEQDKDKSQQDLGDSGFVSGTSLFSSEEVSCELRSKSPPSVAPEPMRAPDSGLDLGLSESLSQLSLQHTTLNSLDKVHSEPTKLTPVSAKVVGPSVTTVADDPANIAQIDNKYIPQEPWEIYYTQDDDGDT